MFSPDNPITRQEIATMVLRAHEYHTGENPFETFVTQEIRFDDYEKVSDWAKNHVVYANAFGYMDGYPDRTFRPQNHCTRAEAATVLRRFMEALDLI